jgi:hypothetical protein
LRHRFAQKNLSGGIRNVSIFLEYGFNVPGGTASRDLPFSNHPFSAGISFRL